MSDKKVFIQVIRAAIMFAASYYLLYFIALLGA